MKIFFVVLLLLISGFPLSYAIFKSRDLAAIGASLTAGLIATVSVLASILTETALLPWISAFFPLSWIYAAVSKRHNHRPKQGQRFRALYLMVLLGFCLFPLAGLQRAPIDWDARSSWFFRSKFFYAGGQAARTAMQEAALDFSHQNYPPFSSATSAFVWRIRGGQDYRTAQVATSALTLSAVLALAFVLLSLHRSGRWNVLLAGLAPVGAYGLAGLGGTNGYVDLLNAACLTTAVVALLVAPRNDQQLFLLGTLALAVAFTTKHEGVILGCFILLIAAVRHRSRSRRIILAACPLLQVLWVLLVKGQGVEGEIKVGSAMSRFFHNPNGMAERAHQVLEAFRAEIATFTILALLTSFVSWALLRHARSEFGFGPSTHIWAILLLYLASLATAYVASPTGIEWLLATTISRTLIVPKLLALTDVAIWFIVASSILPGRASSTLRSRSQVRDS